LISQAETIRDWPVPHERLEQAENHVRLALWEQQMGRISDATKVKVYSLLHFAIPNYVTDTDEGTPFSPLEREAKWEAAYYEQLTQRSCLDCGDGVCPTDDDPPVRIGS
jgi:hypothetical protein